jgi:translation initiation factor IF-3
MPLYQAREVAKTNGLDLVEVASTSVPPVCRLLDYGKFKYEQAKKEREARKNQKIPVLREVRLRPAIGVHDLDSKTRVIEKLLDGGDKVRVVVMFRGREITHPELGWKLQQGVAESLKEVAVVEEKSMMEGRRMVMILAPGAAPKAKKAKEKELAKREEVKKEA